MAQLYIRRTDGAFELAANMAQVEKNYAKLAKAMAGVNLARVQDKIDLSFYDRNGVVKPLQITSQHKLYKLADKILKLAYNVSITPAPVAPTVESDISTPDLVEPEKKPVLPKVRAAPIAPLFKPSIVTPLLQPAGKEESALAKPEQEASEDTSSSSSVDIEILPPICRTSKRKTTPPEKPVKAEPGSTGGTHQPHSRRVVYPRKIIERIPAKESFVAIQETNSPVAKSPAELNRQSQWDKVIAELTERMQNKIAVVKPIQMSAAEETEWASAGQFLEDIDAFGMSKIYEEDLLIQSDVVEGALSLPIDGDIIIEPINPEHQWELVVEELRKKITPKPEEEYYTEPQDAFEAVTPRSDLFAPVTVKALFPLVNVLGISVVEAVEAQATSILAAPRAWEQYPFPVAQTANRRVSTVALPAIKAVATPLPLPKAGFMARAMIQAMRKL